PDLCENCTFEEVAYLLTHDDLPSKTELKAFTDKERSYRGLSEALQKSVKLYPDKFHPMDSLRTGVSFLGMEDERIWDDSPETNHDKFLRLLAGIPSIIAASYRHHKGRDYIPP